jgi:hypothetical protein
MPTLTQNPTLADLPAADLDRSLHQFLSPFVELLPDTRLTQVARMITRGLVISQSPVVTQIARGAGYDDETIWPTCQRAYRFLNSPRFSSRLLFKGLYRVAQRAVAEQTSRADPHKVEIEFALRAQSPISSNKFQFARAIHACNSTQRQGSATDANSAATSRKVAQNTLKGAILRVPILYPNKQTRYDANTYTWRIIDRGLDETFNERESHGTTTAGWN